MSSVMRAREKDGIVVVENVADFDLDHIFDCGQCFRWERDEAGGYLGAAFGRQVRLKYEKPSQTLSIYGADLEDFEKIWRGYMDLDRDYAAIKRSLAEKDEVIARAIDFGSGIRILNQDKWETLVSFIISQNNNIPRIKKCIESLAKSLGERCEGLDGRVFYTLPSAERLAEASLEDLAVCRLGYRAKYLIETARQVAERGSESLDRLGAETEQLSSDEVFEELQHYSGVGPKVANCIALFSMGRLDRFPIDVWVRKVMNRLYGIDEGDMKTMASFARDAFGDYGGIAQQYLFYYITHNKEL